MLKVAFITLFCNDMVIGDKNCNLDIQRNSDVLSSTVWLDSGKRSFIINRRIKTTIRKDILW